MERELLLERARGAALCAYAPYSGFRVGAAVVVVGPGGARVITGANVENASYGLTLCAERVALAAALTSRSQYARAVRASAPHESAAEEPRTGRGRPRITHVAVACIDVPPGASVAQRTPCGACRQWLAELAPDALYYVDGIPGTLQLDDLLPLAFHFSDSGAG
jgi:cytidine deaminase